jgi:hypothetical protein
MIEDVIIREMRGEGQRAGSVHLPSDIAISMFYMSYAQSTFL